MPSRLVHRHFLNLIHVFHERRAFNILAGVKIESWDSLSRGNCNGSVKMDGNTGGVTGDW